MTGPGQTEADATLPLVVVIDDDHDVLEWCRLILEPAGFSVQCFYESGPAFDFMAQHKPDIVISDLMMANLDSGFSVARAVKETPALAEVPVIMMTAASSRHGFDFVPRTPEDLAAMQVDAFFTKPADPKALLSKMHALLANKQRK